MSDTIQIPPRESLTLNLYGAPRRSRRRPTRREVEQREYRRFKGRSRQADYARRCAASGNPSTAILARALLAALSGMSAAEIAVHRDLIERTLAVLAEHGYRPEPTLKRMRQLWRRERQRRKTNSSTRDRLASSANP